MRTFSGARAIGLAIYYASPGKFGPLSATNVFISVTPWQCPQNCVVGRIRESVSVSQQFVSYKHKIFPLTIRPIEESTLSTRKPWGAVLRCVWENLVFAPCAGLCGLWVSLCGLNRWVFVGCTHRKDQTVCTRSKEPRRNPSILSYNHHPVFSRAKWSKEEDQICG